MISASTSCHENVDELKYECNIILHAAEESKGLARTHWRRPDGVTLIPWSRGRCLTWDVTIPDTLAASHALGSDFPCRWSSRRTRSRSQNHQIAYADIATTLFRLLWRHWARGVPTHWLVLNSYSNVYRRIPGTIKRLHIYCNDCQ